MADNYKILAQTTAASLNADNANQANVVYTVPASTQASISSVSLINSSTTAESYYLGVVKSADASSSVSTVNLAETVLDTLFVAVANGFSDAVYSTDGINWTQAQIQPAAISWRFITYGDGKFVAIDNGALSAYSTDGITWTLVDLPASANWQSMTYGNGTFVAVAQFTSTAIYSTDGINWTPTTMPVSDGWQTITYGDGKFVAVAALSGRSAYSTDGITWTLSDLGMENYWREIAYGDGKFVAIVTQLDRSLAYSTDGISWTVNTHFLPQSSYWEGLTYGGGKFVAVTGYNNNLAAYSTDGLNWTQTTMPSTDWRTVTYGGGKFVAVAYGTAYGAYSTDGITWTLVDLPASANWISVATKESASVTITETSVNSIGQAQRIIPTRSIEANTVDEIVGGITLSAGDQIRVYSESPDLIVQVYGVEIA